MRFTSRLIGALATAGVAVGSPQAAAAHGAAANAAAANTPAANTPAINSPAVNSPAINTPAINTPAVSTPDASNTPASIQSPAAATPSDLGSSSVESVAPTTSSAVPTAAVGPPVIYPLDDVDFGEDSFATTVPGFQTAIQLSPDVDESTGFSLFSSLLPENYVLGEPLVLFWSMAVWTDGPMPSRKRAGTDCWLDVYNNGENIFSQDLETGSSFVQVTTESFDAYEEQQYLQFYQICAGQSANVVIANLAIGSPSNPGTLSGNSSVTPVSSVGGTAVVSDSSTETAAVASSESVTGPVTGSAASTTAGTEIVSSTVSSASFVPSSPGFPDKIDGFEVYGCIRSTANFPTFVQVRNSINMSLNQCATFCRTRAYFGVHNFDCFCGDVLDPLVNPRVPIQECSIPCAGDETEMCGGDATSPGLSPRQIPSNILLTVYVAVDGGSSSSSSATGVAATSTIATGSAASSNVVSSTLTTTVGGASSIATQTATVVASGGISVYIFNSFSCSACDGQTVYIAESCSCAGGKKFVPKYCSDGSCSGLVVYKPQPCYDWWNQQNYYVPADCGSCANGTVIYTPWETKMGTPGQPIVAQVPPCSGSGCPLPSQTPTKPGGSFQTIAVVPVGAAGKQAVSGIAYFAALAVALL